MTVQEILTLRKLLKTMQDSGMSVSDILNGGVPVGKSADKQASQQMKNASADDTAAGLSNTLVEGGLNVAGDIAKVAMGIPAIRRSILGKALMTLHSPGTTAIEDVNNSMANARQLRGASAQAAGAGLQLAADTVSGRLYNMSAKHEADKLRQDAYAFANSHPDTPGMFYEYQGTVNKHFGDK